MPHWLFIYILCYIHQTSWHTSWAIQMKKVYPSPATTTTEPSATKPVEYLSNQSCKRHLLCSLRRCGQFYPTCNITAVPISFTKATTATVKYHDKGNNTQNSSNLHNNQKTANKPNLQWNSKRQTVKMLLKCFPNTSEFCIKSKAKTCITTCRAS